MCVLCGPSTVWIAAFAFQPLLAHGLLVKYAAQKRVLGAAQHSMRAWSIHTCVCMHGWVSHVRCGSQLFLGMGIRALRISALAVLIHPCMDTYMTHTPTHTHIAGRCRCALDHSPTSRSTGQSDVALRSGSPLRSSGPCAYLHTYMHTCMQHTHTRAHTHMGERERDRERYACTHTHTYTYAMCVHTRRCVASNVSMWMHVCGAPSTAVLNQI